MLYKTTTFENRNNDEELNGIIKALNIKNRRKRIEFVYDYSCNKIDEFYKGKNVCGFKNNKCYNQQAPNCTYINGCCRLCPYQTTHGCPDSNLSCKLFYCDTVTNKYKTIKMKDLKILKLFSIRQRIIIKDSFFSKRKEILLDLYIGSIIFFAMRLLYRGIRNFIRLKKVKRAFLQEEK